MERTYKSMCISKSNYENEQDFWKAVADMIKILSDNKNIVVFEYDDCGNYRIEYDSQEYLGYGNAQPVWLSCEEKENILFERQEAREEE